MLPAHGITSVFHSVSQGVAEELKHGWIQYVSFLLVTIVAGALLELPVTAWERAVCGACAPAHVRVLRFAV